MNKNKVFALLLPALLSFNNTSIISKAKTNPTDKIYKYLYQEDFEDYTANEKYERQALYLDDCKGTIIDESVIEGKKSLKVEANDARP